jgi:hypothetical protein
MRTTNLQHADPARAGSDPDDDEDLANVDTLAFGEAFLRAVDWRDTDAGTRPLISLPEPVDDQPCDEELVLTAAPTPGPWYWASYDDHLLKGGTSPAGIATILEFDGCRVERDCDVNAMLAEIDANKRLIAAAPELLAALRRLADRATLDRYEDSEIRALVADIAHAAIAKVAA